jgi:NCS1 family nucleobase:cation symporter-1
VLGVALALCGLVLPSLRWLYDYAWFVGFFTSGAAYVVLMRVLPVAIAEPEFAARKA